MCIVQIIMIDVSKVKKRRTNKIARNNWYFILFYRQEGVWCVELARDIWYPLSETGCRNILEAGNQDEVE